MKAIQKGRPKEQYIKQDRSRNLRRTRQDHYNCEIKIQELENDQAESRNTANGKSLNMECRVLSVKGNLCRQ
jgi:hypothetical protein